MLALLGSLRKAGGAPPSPNFITNSLRFRSVNSARLSRTFGTPTDANVYTWSGWVKRTIQNTNPSLFGVSNSTYFGFRTTEAIAVFINNVFTLTTTAIFRDPLAWYHIVYAQNGAAQTIYVNGSIVATGTASALGFNTATSHNIGNAAETARPFDGYLAEINFVDGQALTPSSFGEINSTTGVWTPKEYTGTYGNNGFRLRFNNTSSLATLAEDSSGRGNHWTATNVSLTSGVTYDSMVDVPVNYSDGQNGRGNYAVINSLNPITTASLTSANLQTTSAASQAIVGSMSMDNGSWYWEIQYNAATADQLVGVYKTSATTISVTPTTNVIGVRFNADTGNLDYTVDGTSYSSIATGLTGGGYIPYAASATNAKIIYANFGQRPFQYTRPAGFNALNASNLSNPTIVNPANYVAATIYTGTANPLSISNSTNGVSFQPNLVWIKSRTSNSANHALFDSIRGAANYISSNATATQVTNANTLTAFTANGFDLGTDTALVNANTGSYVAWQWKESATSGVDIVSYTGTGASTTIAHNLGVVPAMIIVKQLTPIAAVSNWQIYHTSIPATDSMQLNLQNQAAAASAVWNNTAPTLNSFSIGTSSDVNAIGESYIAYCFAEISGFSKFGVYQGNSSLSGQFVNCNFAPKVVLIKNSTSGGVGSDWFIYDSARGTNTKSGLRANAVFSELTTTSLDFISTGFKLRTNGAELNGSGNNYIFAAFAEAPFKHALAKF